VGWATGYALSIYGTEYTQQCPFGTGNGLAMVDNIYLKESSMDSAGNAIESGNAYRLGCRRARCPPVKCA